MIPNVLYIYLALVNTNDFDLAEFFGQKAPRRISTISDTKMILGRLRDIFGDDPQFDEDMGKAMYATILQDLRTNRKEEYMSEVGELTISIPTFFCRFQYIEKIGRNSPDFSHKTTNCTPNEIHCQLLYAS